MINMKNYCFSRLESVHSTEVETRREVFSTQEEDLFFKQENSGSLTPVTEASSLTLGTKTLWLLCREICLLSGDLCPAQMVSGVFIVASLSYSLEQAKSIIHSRCPTSCQGSSRHWKQSGQTGLGNSICITSEPMEMLMGRETDCWEIDVCSQPCTERDGHPAVAPSSLAPDKCSGPFGEALSECVWVDSVRGVARRRCDVSILKEQERHVEECWWTQTTFWWIHHREPYSCSPEEGRVRGEKELDTRLRGFICVQNTLEIMRSEQAHWILSISISRSRSLETDWWVRLAGLFLLFLASLSDVDLPPAMMGEGDCLGKATRQVFTSLLKHGGSSFGQLQLPFLPPGLC